MDLRALLGLDPSSRHGDRQFASSNGFYRLTIPGKWVDGVEGPALLLESASHGEAIHVSGYRGAFPEDFPVRLLEQTFALETPTSALLQVEGPGWKGIRRSFRNEGEDPPREWVAIIASNSFGYALVTWNSSAQGSPSAEAMQILGSLELSMNGES